MKTFQGAEATVKVDEDVTKQRKQKNYRHPEIDEKIRTERTAQEIRIIEKANKYGVNTPEILEKADKSFKMERIHGRELREVLDDSPELMEDLADQVARLHSADIIHGDLTTSNVIYTGQEVYLIDFGLGFHSSRTEDRAVDLHLLRQILRTTHSSSEDLWEKFEQRYMEKASEEVLDKLPEIEQRARYR